MSLLWDAKPRTSLTEPVPPAKTVITIITKPIMQKRHLILLFQLIACNLRTQFKELIYSIHKPFA